MKLLLALPLTCFLRLSETASAQGTIALVGRTLGRSGGRHTECAHRADGHVRWSSLRSKKPSTHAIKE